MKWVEIITLRSLENINRELVYREPMGDLLKVTEPRSRTDTSEHTTGRVR